MSCFDDNSFRCGTPQQDMRVDPIRQDANNIARELFSPDPRMQDRAMFDIKNEVHNLNPWQAEHFATMLQQATHGRSPLQTVPETVNDRYGRPHQTGNELLVMTDPYGRSEVLKQIRHDVPQQGYYPQPAPPPVVIERDRPNVGERIVDGVATGVGVGVGLRVIDGLFGHRR